jgi:hypothetical protein
MESIYKDSDFVKSSHHEQALSCAFLFRMTEYHLVRAKLLQIIAIISQMDEPSALVLLDECFPQNRMIIEQPNDFSKEISENKKAAQNAGLDNKRLCASSS